MDFREKSTHFYTRFGSLNSIYLLILNLFNIKACQIFLKNFHVALLKYFNNNFCEINKKNKLGNSLKLITLENAYCV